MALAQVAAVALVGGFAASSSGVAHEALFRLEVDLSGAFLGGKALFRASWDFPEELRKL